MGFTCKRCGGYYCSKDRLPENHSCAFKGMKNEEVEVRMQLERGNTSRAEAKQPYNENPGTERRYYQEKGEPRGFEDDDEEYDSGRYRVGGSPVRMDLTFTLLIFVIFAVIDAVFLLMQPILVMALPLIVHGAFLPFLFYIAIKQKRGQFPPRIIVTFIQLVIAYMVVYMGAEIVVAFVMGNFLMIGIYLFIGIMMVMIWSRLLQQLKYVFGSNEGAGL
jgi:hypothetical protein